MLRSSPSHSRSFSLHPPEGTTPTGCEGHLSAEASCRSTGWTMYQPSAYALVHACASVCVHVHGCQRSALGMLSRSCSPPVLLMCLCVCVCICVQALVYPCVHTCVHACGGWRFLPLLFALFTKPDLSSELRACCLCWSDYAA